ncbi:hypothetical protein [uncultured Campylobacter sp.]|uniref:hypothetical protein n=1 Tax=uncultured Campylobacter sp. TaxID=218934 RepID=UPI002631B776|nr:hypothetical protein [uncultured Campylobacter sp.]
MIATYLLIAALAFLALYFAIQKFTLKVDEKALLGPIKVDLYPKFCDIINDKIKEFKDMAKDDKISLKDTEQKDIFLEKLSDLSRELTFIQTMNLSKKNDELWQSELFYFLKELENLLLDYLNDGEKQSDELREFLMNEFQRLKNP